mgnify:CR=1 FL=1
MPVYNVINKASGEEVTRYCAGQVTESFDGKSFPLADFDHVEFIEDAVPPAPTSVILTKLEYLRRFTQAERVTIREAAKVNPVLEDYMALLELATEIDTGDADTIVAVNMLEQAGLVGPGRAQEILNG